MDISPKPFFRALADPIRLRCLMLLHAEGELCVCELTHALDLAQPKISHHLALLRELGLVNDRRQGLWIHYRLSPDLPRWVNEVLHSTVEGLAGAAPYALDHHRLLNMPNRPGAARCA